MEILAITTKYAALKFLIVFYAYKEIATFVYVYWSRLLFYNNFFLHVGYWLQTVPTWNQNKVGPVDHLWVAYCKPDEMQMGMECASLFLKTWDRRVSISSFYLNT